MKKNIIVLVLLIISCVLFGCATKFSKSYKNPNKFEKQNIHEINGEYNIYAIDSTNNNPKDELSNAFNKFYRGFGRSNTDTLKLNKLDEYSLKLEVKNENKIEIKYFKNKIALKNLNFVYELKPDGYIYIEDKNFKFSGIPYLFGGIDIKKIRLSVDNYENLIIEEVYHSSGALLLIFGDSKTWNYRNYYKRIK